MKVIHKFKRQLKTGDQIKLCTKERCNNAENVSYFWQKVNCPECLKRGGRYA